MYTQKKAPVKYINALNIGYFGTDTSHYKGNKKNIECPRHGYNTVIPVQGSLYPRHLPNLSQPELVLHGLRFLSF